jgi:pimeloyl-ACP methyl ester carboxylesterase
MREERLEVAGVGIQVEDEGGDGVPVLLLHYGGANLRMWDPVIPYLSGRFRCVALDLRGHGKSDAPRFGYRPDDFAGDVAGVLDALGVRSTHIIGCSLGAEVGLSLAADHPDCVRSFVADGALASEYGPYGLREAACVQDDPEVRERLRKMAERPEASYPSREALVEATAVMFEGSPYWNGALEAVTAYGAIETEEGAFVSAWRKWARDAYMRHYYELRVEDYYPRVACPVLMLPDEDTKADSKQFGIVQSLSELPPQCEVEVVPGSDHPFSWMRIPEAMAEVVLGFLARVEGE